jgi:hypothetical protein
MSMFIYCIILLNRAFRYEVTPLNRATFEDKMLNFQAERKARQ